MSLQLHSSQQGEEGKKKNSMRLFFFSRSIRRAEQQVCLGHFPREGTALFWAPLLQPQGLERTKMS